MTTPPFRYLVLLLATLVLLGTVAAQEVGTERVALSDVGATFTNTAACAAVLPDQDGSAIGVLDRQTVGDYAVEAFHDENDNGSMD